jgi:hypothetical protein
LKLKISLPLPTVLLGGQKNYIRYEEMTMDLQCMIEVSGREESRVLRMYTVDVNAEHSGRSHFQGRSRQP